MIDLPRDVAIVN